MADPDALQHQHRITREQAQSHWKDRSSWVLGIIYSCREDPRVIVRNRFTVGWTWNFGHPRVFPTMGAFALFALAPGATLFALGILDVPLLIGVTVAAVAVLVMIARRIESNGGHYMGLSPGPPGRNAEHKYRDPDGVVFDVSEHGWVGTK